MRNKCLMFHIWCFIRTCLKKSVSDVSDDWQMESWFDMTFEMTFKTSFNALCLRFLLQKHFPRFCQILWRINEVKVWNSSIVIKRRVLLHKTCYDTKKWLPVAILKHASFEEWTFCMREGCAFNASIKCSQWSYSLHED